MEPSISSLVHILLSTHNGGAFIREQMNSLIRQTYQPIVIHVRDDGSVDETPQILAEYEKRYSRVHIAFGDRVGINRSYYQLLNDVSGDSDLFAFCDQDDVWNENKIEKAVNRLSKNGHHDSTLYLSRYLFADEQLNPIRTSDDRRHLYFENAVVESGVAGCAMVFGSTLKNIMLRSDPDDWNMHDWWMYLVATAFGEVLFDPVPRLYYRRHSGNVTSWEKSYAVRVLERIKLFSGRRKSGSSGLISLQQAGRFIRQYEGAISQQQREIVLNLEQLRNENILRRVAYVMRPQVRRERIFDQLVLLLVIVLGQH